MAPSIGRIVHYTDRDINGCRPAIIVRVWTAESVQVQVFTDGANDQLDNVVWRTSVAPTAIATKGNPSFHSWEDCPAGTKED